MATGTIVTDNFRRLLHDLPQEQYDHILDLVFPTDSCLISVTTNYAPPSRLHVTGILRKTFAIQYYGGTAFRFHDHDLLCEWLLALPQEHRALLEDSGLILCVHCSAEKLRTDPDPGRTLWRLVDHIDDYLVEEEGLVTSIMVIVRAPTGEKESCQNYKLRVEGDRPSLLYVEDESIDGREGMRCEERENATRWRKTGYRTASA